jgi:hypothetical protein
VYVDLEAEPKIDKDSPPDLRFLTEGVEAPAAAAAAAAAAADGSSNSISSLQPAASKAGVAKAAKPAAAKKAAAKPDSSKVHMQVGGSHRRGVMAFAPQAVARPCPPPPGHRAAMA